MNLYIDINSRQAVNGIGVASPIQPITFKDQDTPAVDIYFVLEGVVQDEGSGTAIKFGLNLPPPNPISLLVYDTTFTRQVDANGNIFYQGFPVFYTSQLAAALGSSTSIQCVGEVRTQLSDGEIFRSMDIPFVIWRTILLETTTPPPDIVAVYPDASTLEIIPHKGQPSGYAGLDTGSHILGANIPVDGVTIQILDGQIAAAPILAETSATFVTPAAHVNVTVTLVSSTGLVAGQYVRLPVAGYYIVESITDSTHAVLQNNGDPVNAASGVTIAIDTPLLPAQAAAGGGGSPGQNAYTTTTASFVVPAIGTTVSVAVASTAWMGGSGYYVFITGAGYYAVNAITDSTHVVLTNTGSASNAIAGTTVGSGVTVSAAGPSGAAGTPGASGAALSAYDALASSFVMPAAAANVTITIANTAWMATGQVIYITSAGYFQVATISSATQAGVTNLNYPGNASSGGTIASGSKVSAGGLIGATGSGGAGKNAFTNLAANFTQPAVNATVSINVGTTAWMAIGQIIFVQGGGYYSVASITDLTDAVVTNLGYAGNAAPSVTVTSGSTVAVTPGGLIGTSGADAFTTTTASFTQPTSGSTVTAAVLNTSWIAQGQNLYIPGAGYYSVSVVTDSTHVVLTNSGVSGSASAGTTIASASKVSPAGAQGQQGIQGVQGAPGSLSNASDAGGGAVSPEVSLIQIISAGTLSLKKLKAGSNVTLTDQGGSTGDVLIAASSGGGGPGLGYWDPSNGLFFQDDFIYNASGGPTSDNRYSLSSGTGGSINGNSTYGQNATLKVLGSLELVTGTSASNTGAGFAWGGNFSTPYFAVVYGLGAALTFKTRVILESTLPATGGGYALRAGIAQALGTLYFNQPNQGFFFEYSPDQNSGQWRVGVGAGSITYTNSSATVAADTAYDLEIDVNAAWTSISFLINGVTAATVASGIPTSSGMPIWQYAKGSAGTLSRLAVVDSWMIYYPVAR